MEDIEGDTVHLESAVHNLVSVPGKRILSARLGTRRALAESNPFHAR